MKPEPRTDVDLRRRLLVLRANGLSYRQIAAQVGRSTSRVYFLAAHEEKQSYESHGREAR